LPCSSRAQNLPGRAAVALLAVLVLCAVLATTPVRQAAAQPAEMSPDEAALQFRPYVLSNDNAPAGYTVTGTSAYTPASLAFYSSNEVGKSPIDALTQYEGDGLVILIGQALRRAAAASGPNVATFNSYLMRNSDAAHNIVDLTAGPYPVGFISVNRVDGAASVGEYSVLYQLIGRNGSEYDLRWSRGQVAYSIFGSMTSGLNGLAPLATSIDAIEVTNPSIDLSAPTFTPPGDETTRLQSLLRMSTIAVAPSAIPAGFSSSGPSVMTVAGSVLATTEPDAALASLDGNWQRLIGVDHLFASTGSTRYSYGFDEDASAEAQAVDIRDFGTNPNPPTLETSPVALGDDSFLIRGQSKDASGQLTQYVEIQWRHGALALVAEISGKPGSVNDADVAAFAQAVEDAYQQSAYVTN
jgi:hypothetical protein